MGCGRCQRHDWRIQRHHGGGGEHLRPHGVRCSPHGIAVSGGDLWVTNGGSGTIGEYNATTGAAVGTALVSGLSDPFAIAVSGGNLWVSNYDNNTIGEYNATTGATINAALVSGVNGPAGIAVSGGDLWVTNFHIGTIGEYNATSGAVVNASLVSSLSGPIGIAVSGGNLWVADDVSDTIGEYNATTGAPAAAVTAASITDGQSTTLSSLTVTLASPQTGDVLTATASGGITVAPYNPTTGVLLLSGTASLAAYDAVLASVQYNNTNEGPGVASETVNVVANDGTSKSNTARCTIRFTIPQVVGVQVAGIPWSPSFLDALQHAGEGNGGYAIPVGSAAQSRPCHGATCFRSRLPSTKR